MLDDSKRGQDLEDPQTTDERDIIKATRTMVGDSEGKPSANHVLSCPDRDDRIGQSKCTWMLALITQ